MRALTMSCIILASLSACKTTHQESQISNSDGNLGANTVINIFESIPLNPIVNEKLKDGGSGNNIYIGKAQDASKRIMTVLYATDNYDIRIADVSEVIDLTELGEDFSWTSLKRKGVEKGKFFKVDNNLITDLCSGEFSSTCKLQLEGPAPVFSAEGKSFRILNLKSYAMIKVEPKISQSETLQISFQFERPSLAVNVAESDLSEYSMGLKCKDTSYLVDYFSAGPEAMASLSISDLAKRSQKSIWTKDGENLLADDDSLESDFKIESAADRIVLNFSGKLLDQIKKECGDKIKKSALVVSGLLARPG